MEFEAVLTDCPAGGPPPRFRWETSDGNLRILTPQAQRTLVAADSLPSWCESRLSVTAAFGNDTLLSELLFHYGIHEDPQATPVVRAPEVLFLNDDDRTSRWYRVEVSLSCPVETNATISIEHAGGTGAKFATDPVGAHRFALTNVTLRVSAGGTSAPYLFYCACTNLGTGTFSVKCADSDGDSRTVSKAYKVIEPLRKLVITEEAPNGGYYNPSRLVYGTNAWLKVVVNGDFDATGVVWRVVSGPGRIVATNGWAVSVEPTATNGEVVVEAAFGRDSAIQPRFVLPIATVRHIPVRAFVCRSGTDIAATESSILSKIDYANRIFSQIGIYFDLLSTSNNVGSSSA